MSDELESVDATEETAEDESAAPELRDDEKLLIEQMREAGVTPAQLVQRARAAQAAVAAAKTDDDADEEDDDPERVITLKEARSLIEKATREVQQKGQTQTELQAIRAQINTEIDKDKLIADKPKRRKFVLDQVIEKLKARPDITVMDEHAFAQAVAATTRAAIKEEHEYVQSAVKRAAEDEAEGRKAALEKMGEQAEGDVPKSNVTSTDKGRAGSGNRITHENMRFGPNMEWPDDAEIEEEMERAGARFMKAAK